MTEQRAEDASYWLEQIATALGIPVSTLLHAPREPLNASAAVKQEEELLRLFREITDPDLRNQLLGFVRAAVSRSKPSEG